MLLFNVILFVIIFIIYTLTEISCECKSDNAKSTMQKLKQKLFCDYDKTVRPAVSKDNATSVEVSIIVKYYDFSDRTSQLSVHMWLCMVWIDEHLKWNTNDYDNIEDITIKSNEIWLPDLTLYNSAKTDGSSLVTETDCSVDYNGTVKCIPNCIHTVHCEMDLKHWPYDTQICGLDYGPWYYFEDQLIYSLSSDEPSRKELHKESKTWNLTKIDASENREYDESVDQYYTTLNYNFFIVRHYGSQIVTVILPAFVLILLILITMSLKPNSLERFYLFGISLLLHFTFLNYLSWMIPANGATIPSVLSFYKDSLFLTIFGLLITCIVRNLMSSTSAPPFYVSAFASVVMKNVPVQVILLRDIIPKVTNANSNNEENVDLVSTTPTVQYSKEWFVFAQCIDKITFICYIVTYIIMMFALLPI